MFSVVIPLYNKATFIHRAVESVLTQTFPYFELIIVNDGSTDSSLSALEKFITDNRVRIFSQENSGVSVARNKGAHLARYSYLAFLDADDAWEENFLLQIEKLIRKFPDAGIYATNNYFLYPSGKFFKNELDSYFLKNNTGIIEDYFDVFAELKRSPFSNSNIVIPKIIYDEMGGYKSGVKLTEDSDLWCRIALKYTIAYDNRPLSTYYLSIEGSTHSIFENKQFEVINTLQMALHNNLVCEDKIKSVKKLIALQKIGFIKRGILTRNKHKIFFNFFDFKIILYYPIEYFKCLASYLIPNFIFKLIR